ncbi:NAC domain-containing protein 104-like [Senna tora]|uniref:NAC domain-containing protein 104-like n=1 Tax=Senna tora TaxID=362788 RepID=A0A835CHC1_9FABA|nr:NAC domain-containing protein 104-like [Senna tora]
MTEKALSSGNELYFFTRLKQKRETESGFWKEIGVTEPIVSANYNSAGNINNNVGFKKYLVFTINGSNQEAHETNWLMQEYHLLSSFHSTTPRPAECERQSKWVLCRVYERKRDFEEEDDGASTELSWVDEVFMSLLDDDVEQISFLN